MDAIWLEHGQLHYRRGLPDPAVGPGLAVVRVRLAGICGTDLAMLAGYAAFTGILGHEFVGAVIAADDPAWVGQRVVAEINIGGRHAPDRRVIGIRDWPGAFATALAVPLRNLHHVPTNLSDEQAVFCEPLAAACRVAEQVEASRQLKVAVIGPGRLGLLIGQVLSREGHEVVMLGRGAPGLARAEALGLPAAPATAAASNGFDLVVEATGNPTAFDRAVDLVRPLGTLVLKSTWPGQASLDLSRVVVKEVRVQGSRCGSFGPALALLARRQVLVEPLIEATYPLTDGLAAFDHAARPGAGKILLRP